MVGSELQLPLAVEHGGSYGQVDAAAPEEALAEPETVTLYGEILEQRENETVFRFQRRLGDDLEVVEIVIPNEQIQMPAFGDPGSTEDMITLTRA